MNGRTWTSEEITKLTELYNSEFLCESIAQILGRSAMAVMKKCHKIGLQHRPRTKEHSTKLSHSLQGNTPWNKDKKGCQVGWNKGKKAPWASGDKNPKWNGGRKVRGDGYVQIWLPEHPRASKEGYVMEHVVAMGEVLNRTIKLGEIVHHINGIRSDNRPENLMLFNNASEHQTYHAYLRRRMKQNA